MAVANDALSDTCGDHDEPAAEKDGPQLLTVRGRNGGGGDENDAAFHVPERRSGHEPPRTCQTETGHPPVRDLGGVDGTLAALAVTRRAIAEARKTDDDRLARADELLLEAERQLRHVEKMEMIGRLAGGVAHDFNNHLSVILSYGDLLLEEMEPGAPMRDDVAEMFKAAQLAADLTRQLLMFTRQQPIEPEALDLNEVLASVDSMLRRIIGASVALVTVPTRPLASVQVDRRSIEHVVVNLAVNARHAMPSGGTLTIETANVRLDEDLAAYPADVKRGHHVMLAVTDTGIGMDVATQARIFEPSSTNRAGERAAFGLATVLGIVEESGGAVTVRCEPGKGTSFIVYLPQSDAPSEERGSVSHATALRGSETILLVDSDDRVRGAARAILRRGGYHVIESRNADEARMHAARHPGVIDLLLTDAVLSHVSGPMLARQLAADRPHMKVLCMLPYAGDGIGRDVADAHFDYVPKPITPESLTRRIREVLDRHGR